MKDLVISKKSYTVTITAEWMEYLADFGLTEKDFGGLGKEIEKAVLNYLPKIILAKEK